MSTGESPAAAPPMPYRVLARKYRPTTFVELVGQDILVRTLTNAIQSGRIAQAYVLTGVRGVGKTSTARILARALNCVGPDGNGGPTVTPCGVCDHCRAIAEDRHVDVLEMDAASRTGVNDIRELIESVRYRPTSARYKIYIIDEVHMLSNQAFNALLKTLEEPPEHVKFIFATTEIRKVPVTVLSRCQRFDLRRVEPDALAEHFGTVAAREGATVETGALRLIARAADGSVRDGLSLLDQAIAHTALALSGGGAEPGVVTEAQVRGMLGLADRTQVFDLLDAALRGDPRAALELLRSQYHAGADPGVVIQDMLELTHWLTRVRVVPESADDPTVPQAERERGRDMAGRLSMSVLTRTWQLLLKALGEVRQAPSPIQAAEMALVRLAYAADLPTPAEALAALKAGGGPPAPAGPRGGSPQGPGPQATMSGGPAYGQGQHAPSPVPSAPSSGPQALALVPRPIADPDRMRDEAPILDRPVSAPAAVPATGDPRSLAEVVALFQANREMLLAVDVRRDVHLVHFEPGRIEFRPTATAKRDLANRIQRLLSEMTGRRWVVSVTNEPGQPTLADQEQAARTQSFAAAAADPLVRAVLVAFPGAEIVDVTNLHPGDNAGTADDTDGATVNGLADEAPDDTIDDTIMEGDDPS